MRRLLLVLACVATATLAAPDARAGNCPTVTFTTGAFDPATPVPITTLPWDQTIRLDACRVVRGIAKPAEGYAESDASDGCTVASGAPACGSEMVIEDDFTASGPTAGTPLTFTLGLQLYMQAFCEALPGAGGIVRLTGSLREGTSNEDSFTLVSPDNQHFVGGNHLLRVTVHAVAGTPFHLRYAVRTESLEGEGDIGGLLFVYDAPQGLTFDSCGGFRIENPVPARTSTWGRLKAAYR